MITIGITLYMDCAHHLPGHPKCGGVHGHTYQIDIELKDELKLVPDQLHYEQGMVMDFGLIKEKLRVVLDKYDHKDLNLFLTTPTVENIATMLYAEFKQEIPIVNMVTVHEGHNKWAKVQ